MMLQKYLIVVNMPLVLGCPVCDAYTVVITPIMTLTQLRVCFAMVIVVAVVMV